MRHSRLFTPLITFALTVFVILGALHPPPADAIVDDLLFVSAVTGTYFLTQADVDQFKRIVTITADGNFFSISQESPKFGFSDGQGAWKRLGSQQKITARILDFDFDTTTGKRLSVTRVTFTLTFSEKVNGKFQTVSGELLAEQFALDQNPLDPNAEPFNTFPLTSFTGQRITAD
jgi:hypothetical protein